MDLDNWMIKQKLFSEKTFGPGARVEGLLKHIEKEVEEVRKKPQDIYEWIDIAILALDGAWRAGYTPEQVSSALKAKQKENIYRRRWPDKPPSQDEAGHHIK